MRRQEAVSSIYGSAWRNCYWFARMLLNTDQYAAPGKNERVMNKLLSKIEPIIMINTLSEEDKYTVCRDALMNELDIIAAGKSKSAILRRNFRDDISMMITCLDDIAVFLFTVRYVVLPLNSALRNIPNDDRKFCREQAAQILSSLGKAGAGKVLASWDALGVRGCLNIEREEIITEFTKLRAALDSMKSFPRSQLDDNAVLTAFVQEFERRAGQKRKNRAGGSLEDAVDFLLVYRHKLQTYSARTLETSIKCRQRYSQHIQDTRNLAHHYLRP